MKKNKLYLAAAFIIFFPFILKCFWKKTDVSEKYIYKTIEMKKFKIKNKFIYIKTYYWGVSRDKQAIIVSFNNVKNVDTINDLVFEGERNYNLFYEKNDTLHLAFNFMNPKYTNTKFQNYVKIDSIKNEYIYDLFFNNKLLDDKYKISRF